jgi:hypothetical protein
MHGSPTPLGSHPGEVSVAVAPMSAGNTHPLIDCLIVLLRLKIFAAREDFSA